MNNTTALASIIIIAMCVACSSGDKKEVAPSKEKIATPLPDKVPAVEKKPAIVKITGNGTCRNNGDSGLGTKVSIALSYGDDKHVTGSINVLNNKHKVEGILDGDTLRCWVVSSEGNTKTVWRGTLLGKKTSSGFEGTFALSDNGAAKTVNGTWLSNI